jgi:hypothetical protein
MLKYLPSAYNRKRSCLPFFCLIAPFVFSVYGCVTGSPEHVSVLTAVPMGHTMVASYLSVEKVYASDKEIVLLAHWNNVHESDNHTLKWEVLNADKEVLFSNTRENLAIRSHMWSSVTVPLEQTDEKKLMTDQLVVNVYIDDKLAKSERISYEHRTIENTDFDRAVILPFRDNSDYAWPQDEENAFENTFADALFCEVQRIFPESIPHYIVEQKAGKMFKRDCFHSTECISYLKDVFGDNIFIFGEFHMQHTFYDNTSLTIYVYNPKTGQSRRFFVSQGFHHSFPVLMHDLLYQVFYDNGLWEYLSDL